jgi:hypothetical protein
MAGDYANDYSDYPRLALCAPGILLSPLPGSRLPAAGGVAGS